MGMVLQTPDPLMSPSYLGSPADAPGRGQLPHRWDLPQGQGQCSDIFIGMFFCRTWKKGSDGGFIKGDKAL